MSSVTNTWRARIKAARTRRAWEVASVRTESPARREDPVTLAYTGQITTGALH